MSSRDHSWTCISTNHLVFATNIVLSTKPLSKQSNECVYSSYFELDKHQINNSLDFLWRPIWLYHVAKIVQGHSTKNSRMHSWQFYTFQTIMAPWTHLIIKVLNWIPLLGPLKCKTYPKPKVEPLKTKEVQEEENQRERRRFEVYTYHILGITPTNNTPFSH